MKYAHIVHAFRSRAWAVKADTFASMLELVARWARGDEKFSHEEVEKRIGEANARNGMNRGGDDIYHEPLMISSGSQRGGSQRGAGGGIVCLIPVIGVISHRSSMLHDISSGGGTSVEKLTSQFRQAIANPAVKAIVLDCDSPGGGVDNVFELAQEIYEARGRKKIIAVANTLAASACYAIAAAASELVVVPSGQVGSIGVFASHEDHSEELAKAGVKISLISAGKYKTEGNSLEPLSDSARAELQDKVNDFYQMFVRCVASFRGDSQANVRAGYGQGRCCTALDSVRANLSDRVGTLDDVLSGLGIARPGMASAPAGERVLDGRMEAPENYVAAVRRRQWLLDVGGMPGVSRHPREAPENARRRRQLLLDAGGIPSDARAFLGHRTEAPDVALARRRRQLSLLEP